MSAEDGAANCFHKVAVLERQVREEGAGTDVDADAPRAGCACFLALDVLNAFNTLSRRAIWRLFEKHYLRVDRPPQGLDGMYRAREILWPVQTYYGVVGKLRYYRDGNTFLTDRKAGVHQGNPLGRNLYCSP